MKKLILSSALGAAVMLVAACGDGAEEATVDTAETDAMATGDAMADAGASADWPAGTRIVEEDGVTYRVNADGTRVELTSGDWRIVTEGEERYRVSSDGTRIRIDEDGLDLDGVASGPDIPGVDVDVGTNADGNLDVDVNTEGRDATPGD
jgi:hypothetical protein